MPDSMVTRRGFFKEAGALAAPLLASLHSPPLAAAASQASRQLKVLCVGGHPDDPESGCAGTLCRYAELGHLVTVLYLTRGERGIRDTGLDAAAKIRTAECEEACRIMGVKAKFFGQIDGDTSLTRDHVNTMSGILSEIQPDVLFTHWPVDTHMDHQVASLLTIRGWMAGREGSRLYFFEVNTGSQTQGFLPNTYVDVSTVLDKKKSALFAHASQDGKGIWREHHEVIAQWRGREAGVAAAEAFVHLDRQGADKTARLPGD